MLQNKEWRIQKRLFLRYLNKPKSLISCLRLIKKLKWWHSKLNKRKLGKKACCSRCLCNYFTELNFGFGILLIKSIIYCKRVNMKKLIIASVLAAVLLIGCSKGPLDTTFDLTNLQTLTDSSKKIHEELPEQESEIVQWAINTLNIGTVESIEKFKEQYGADITYRKILKLAVEKRKQNVFDEYERLKSIEKDWTDIYNDLSKIKASNISLGTSSEFFTRGKPLVSFDVHNGSKQDLSSIQWEIDLYLDDEEAPYSTYRNIDSYTYGSKED